MIELDLPIIGAPMAGGTTTPELVAAVSNAGGLGFLAAGYKRADAVADDLAKVRALTDRPFGVNVFVPSPRPADAQQLAAYAERLRAAGVDPLGEPRFEDDDWDAKLALLERERPAVVSFTFGCPPREILERFSEAWVTVTTLAEARAAREAGAAALVVQGAEAGAHRGSFIADDGDPIALLALLALVAAEQVPMVAAGGVATGAGLAAVLAAGARAAAVGTALMLTDEAGTSPVHRAALADGGPTRLTRAFTGREARGIVNRFLADHTGAAPAGYPEIHHLTAPMRAAARSNGDRERLHLWAGQAHALARTGPAGDLVITLAAEARDALVRASAQLGE